MQKGQRAGLEIARLFNGCLYQVAHVYYSYYLHIIMRCKAPVMAKLHPILKDERHECQRKSTWELDRSPEPRVGTNGKNTLISSPTHLS